MKCRMPVAYRGRGSIARPRPAHGGEAPNVSNVFTPSVHASGKSGQCGNTVLTQESDLVSPHLGCLGHGIGVGVGDGGGSFDFADI